jgi:hypothetical protein
MKKIIALLVVFALFAGSAFAVDLGGAVNGTVTLLQGDSIKDSDVTSGMGMDRIRIEGAGQTDDGVFGGWLRMEGASVGANGLAWWKPIDMLKIIIGGNPDGHWGKEGVTGWMFSQTAYDSGVTNNTENIWGGGMYNDSASGGPWSGNAWNGNSRQAFFAGDGWSGLRIEITPMDILAIKVGLPTFGTWEDNFNNVVAQVDLNLAFGNIALSYQGQGEKKGKLFGYVGLPISIVNLDVGVGIPFDTNDDAPDQLIWAGLGLKVGLSDLFQIRLRTYAGFGGEKADPFRLTADVMPYFILSDSLRAGLTIGFAMASFDKDYAPYTDGESIIGFNINPYIEVGQEWGPKFLAGFYLKNNGWKQNSGNDDAISNWGFAIGIQSSF